MVYLHYGVVIVLQDRLQPLVLAALVLDDLAQEFDRGLKLFDACPNVVLPGFPSGLLLKDQESTTLSMRIS